MAVFVSVLRVPKAGSDEHECEDAAATMPAGDDTVLLDGPVSVAVADGASESLLSGEWARLLVDSVVARGVEDACVLLDRSCFADALTEASLRWAEWFADYPARREARGRPVQWYEQPKLDKGAYSTILAARFDDGPTAEQSTWCAAALGDSCLFQVRGHKLIRAFPIESAADFDSTPALVNSRGHDQELLAARVGLAAGDANFGDQFFLSTDALAAWFLDEAERGAAPWEVLYDFTRCGDIAGFVAWLGERRDAGEVRNDDVTVIHVDLG
jgi:hypothetical protein